MGELHLEIARDRLVNDFKAKATMGDIEISYRECVLVPSETHRTLFDREIAGKKGKAACSANIEPFDDFTPLKQDHTITRDGNHITLRVIGSNASHGPLGSSTLPPDLPLPKIREALINGAVAALARGPRRNFPLHASHVTLTIDPTTDIFPSETSPAAISSAARLAVRDALREVFENDNIGLMEPVMNAVISCNERTLGAIVHDISSARGGHVMSLESDGNDETSTDLPAIDPSRIYTPPDPFVSGSNSGTDGPGQQRQVTARVPLKEMVGYLKHLRSITGGRGTFVMTVDKFERLSGPREKAV
jgi:elongation factor G